MARTSATLLKKKKTNLEVRSLNVRQYISWYMEVVKVYYGYLKPKWSFNQLAHIINHIILISSFTN